MQKQRFKKEYFILCAVIGLFFFISFLSLKSLQQLQGNGRVINFVSLMRGATQKLVKEEIMGTPDDALIVYLDSIIWGLLNGNGVHKLHVLDDDEYINNLRKVEQKWQLLKEEIMLVRSGADPWPMFYSSQELFSLANETVFAAERFSERNLNRSFVVLSNAIFIFLALVIIGLIYYVWSIALRKKADTLGKIAYIDPLTKIENAAGCDRFIESIKENNSGDNIAVFMFDTNNLKIINDLLGHQAGDTLITDFAQILHDGVKNNGFVGRYGGGKFLAIFKNADVSAAENFLFTINKHIDARNNLYPNELEKISFSTGYIVGNTLTTGIEDLIKQADKKTYNQRRRYRVKA
jgi:diguanylate cyclase (GGDEF)-like protein